MQWFVNTGDDEEIHDSEEAAVNAANEAISDWRDCCDPDWPDEVAFVCYGPVYGYAVENAIDDEHSDYVLRPTDQAERLPLTDELRWILGRPCFWCASYANVLRITGQKIEHKAEDEQAAVIYWMMSLYLQHGAEKWREVADAFLKDVKSKATSAGVS